MNGFHYDLPLQQKNQLSLNKSQNSFERQISSIEAKSNQNFSPFLHYDLPQQVKSIFSNNKKQKQNRPLLVKTLFSQTPVSNNYEQEQLIFSKLTQKQYQKFHVKTEKIKEKILQFSEKKEKIIQATFKPQQLKKELELCRNQSLKKIILEKTLNKRNIQQNQTKKLKRNIFNEPNMVKTRYQKVLQEHFSKLNPKLHEKAVPCPQSKISQTERKSSQRLTQTKTPMERYSSCKDDKRKKNQNISQIQTNKKPEMKRSSSERWMSLNFSDRQKKNLEIRKEKEEKGKKEKIENEIKPCTFRPTLYERNKSCKILKAQKQTYLQIYYDRLSKKF